MSEELERKKIDKHAINWDEHAAYWDTFPDGQLYTEKTFNLLTNYMDLKGLKILDFGSGTGILTEKMAPLAQRIVAIDPSQKMIEVLAKKGLKNVITVNDYLATQTVNENSALHQKFDLIVASSVCNFLPNFEETLTVIKSLLTPNGKFIQWDWLQATDDTDFGFTEEMIRKSYQNVGLRLESISVPFHLIENDEKMEVIMAVGTL